MLRIPVKNCDLYLCVWFLLVYILIETSEDPRLMPIAVVFPMADGGGRWENLQLGAAARCYEQGFLERAQVSVRFPPRQRWLRPLPAVCWRKPEVLLPSENEFWMNAWVLLFWMCVVRSKVRTHWSSRAGLYSSVMDAIQFPFSSSVSPLLSRSYIPFVSDWILSTPIFCWFNPH